MVHPEGFEPPTPGFEVQHSIQLSYECKKDTLTIIILKNINYYILLDYFFIFELISKKIIITLSLIIV